MRGKGHHRNAGSSPGRPPKSRPARPAGSAGRTGPRRQWPIRRTMTLLLAIPLVSMIVLWAYAATTTIGPYLAQRNGQTLNREIGASSEQFLAQLTEERADTLAYQTRPGAVSRATLTSQRAATDAAATALKAGLAQTAGIGGTVSKTAAAALVNSMGGLTSTRTQVDAGSVSPLAAFANYNHIVDVYFQYVRTQLVSDTSIGLYQQGEAVIDSAQSLEMLGREAAVVGGALAAGGKMSAAEYQQFVLALDEQRLLIQTINSPQSWPLTANPFQSFYGSSSYQELASLENQVVAAGPNSKLPFDPTVWQAEVQSTLRSYGDLELEATDAITASSARVGHGILIRLIVVGGAGLLAVVIVSFLLVRFGNRLTRELTGFYRTVRSVAEERLPSLVQRLSDGQEVDVDLESEASPLALETNTLEVARIADGFSVVQRTAVTAAVGQAELRRGVSNIFRSLARRNQSLLQRQLRMLDDMERRTEDPDALAQLFRLDHLTTRMRRQSEGLIILSGATPGRRWNKPVPVIEVLRGATGEIEDYVRVDLATESEDMVAGSAVADLTHLLAELIENAAQYSPPQTRVQVKTGWGASGFIVEVEDRGLGVPAATMDELNQRLTHPPEFDLADSDQLGLLVVGRLARRHGIRVTLRSSAYGGAAAIVLIPKELVVPAGMSPTQENRPALAASPAAGPPAARWAPFPDLTPARTTSAVDVARPPAPAPSMTPRSAPGAPDEELGSGEDAGSGTYAGLPRRNRQANLAPELRESSRGDRRQQANGHTPGPGDEPDGGRSAEQARSLISSIQQGWRSGRAAAEQADDPDGGRPGDPPADGRPESNGHYGPRGSQS
ncbi:MAG: nitrate- and nitrite sensing domain-containing protein [Actinobacteria bacterium]|nr:nitrate- and nitrite sensing domain-containing protein [Actinomycetota bacterium]